mmetsp:Transcript_11814/g.14696  ORF Transcript_11814/g.14696 Transcript_11814/m.14696 type:complete len:201 (-) Transcript_11814:719-1321(-)
MASLSFGRIRAASVSSLADDSPSGSPFRLLTLNSTVCLPPAYIGRSMQGFEELLNARLLRYDPRLGGVPLTYSDIKIKGNAGRVFNELPELIYEVSMKCLVFATPSGMRMKGTINEVTAGHITLLVCGAFQVSIAKDQINERYTFDVSSTAWKSSSNSAETIKIGVEVWFKVLKVHDKAGAWFIEGSMIDDNLGVAQSPI